MARVAEQGRAVDRPSRQWLAIEQRPDEAGLGGRDDPSDLWMPAIERGAEDLRQLDAMTSGTPRSNPHVEGSCHSSVLR